MLHKYHQNWVKMINIWPHLKFFSPLGYVGLNRALPLAQTSSYATGLGSVVRISNRQRQVTTKSNILLHYEFQLSKFYF